MSNPMQVDNLCELAGILADGVRRFEDLAADAPAIPDTGASSDAVANALVALSDAMATAAASAVFAADLVQANAVEFDAADTANAASLLDSEEVPR